MLYILMEKGYSDFQWCQRTVHNLLDEIRKKRLPYQWIGAISEIPASDDESAVILIGGSDAWFYPEVRQAKLQHITPICMINRTVRPADDIQYSVGMDLSKGMQLTVKYLHSLNRKRLALFGVNPNSASDPEGEKYFKYTTQRDEHIYTLETSYSDMYQKFKEHVKEYDGVICTNDYAAFYLVHNLIQMGIDPTKDIYIIGFGNMRISKLSTPSITSVSDDFEHYGRAALSIYNLLQKEKYISKIHIQLNNHLHIRDTTGNMPYEACKEETAPEAKKYENLFFRDKDIVTMSEIEAMLNQCDETDYMIIQCLVKNMAYAEIARRCYISETAAKYRIKKMESICQVTSRSELCKRLRWIV